MAPTRDWWSSTRWRPGSRRARWRADRKSTRLNSSHSQISYAVFCLKKTNRATARSRKRTARFEPGVLSGADAPGLLLAQFGQRVRADVPPLAGLAAQDRGSLLAGPQ